MSKGPLWPTHTIMNKHKTSCHSYNDQMVKLTVAIRHLPHDTNPYGSIFSLHYCPNRGHDTQTGPHCSLHLHRAIHCTDSVTNNWGMQVSRVYTLHPTVSFTQHTFSLANGTGLEWLMMHLVKWMTRGNWRPHGAMSPQQFFFSAIEQK